MKEFPVPDESADADDNSDTDSILNFKVNKEFLDISGEDPVEFDLVRPRGSFEAYDLFEAIAKFGYPAYTAALENLKKESRNEITDTEKEQVSLDLMLKVYDSKVKLALYVSDFLKPHNAIWIQNL